jgi:G3E family GTPase
MLSSLPASTLRAKAVLWLSDHQGHRTVFQRVGRRSSYTADDWNNETPESSLVVIGPADSIDPTALTRQFEACRI